MDYRILVLHYNEHTVEVKVEVDRSSLVDVFMDYDDDCSKLGLERPEFPTLSYVKNRKHVYLNCDNDLMVLYEAIKKERLDIWVGEGTKPHKVWEDAMRLKEVQRKGKDKVLDGSVCDVNVVGEGVAKDIVKGPFYRKKLQIMRRIASLTDPEPTPLEAQGQDQAQGPEQSPFFFIPTPGFPEISLDHIETHDITNTPPEPVTTRSPPTSQTTSQKTPPPKKKKPGVSTPIRRSPRFIQGSVQTTTQGGEPGVVENPSQQASAATPMHGSDEGAATPMHGSDDVVLTQTSRNIPVQMRKQRVWEVNPGRKVPKSTALRKGLFKPTQKTSNVGESSSQRPSRTKPVQLRTEEEHEVDDDDFEGLGSDEYDDDFEVDDDDDDHDSETSLEAEENEEWLSYIEDDYNPNPAPSYDLDDDEYFNQLYKNGELVVGQQFGSVQLRPWMIFTEKDHFKTQLKDFCVQEGFTLVVNKSDSKRFTAECAAKGCPWRIHASCLVDGYSWAIKTLSGLHTCTRLGEHNPMADVAWAVKKLMDDIRANPDIPMKALNQLLLDRYGVNLKGTTMYKVKRRALHEIEGGHDTSYELLPAYAEIARQTNHGSLCECVWEPAEHIARPLEFQTMFVCFDSLLQGVIKGCRGLIGVDGTFLKGHYGGILLTAICLDGNNEIFPFAYAVVGSECLNAWGFFFHHLKNLLKDSGRTEWTIICDRQKGLLGALEKEWSSAGKRFCVKHLSQNFKKKFPGPLMSVLFWRAVNATSEFCFNKAWERMLEKGGVVLDNWFASVGDVSAWSKHKFNLDVCAEDNTTNFVESFNNTIGVQRVQPVLTMLEGVRRMIMVRHATRWDNCQSWDDNGICPKITKQLSDICKDSWSLRAYPSTAGEFEIQDGRSYLAVSLNNCTCACGLWQISGIPCKHACKAILFSRQEPKDYVSDWFSVKRYRQAYQRNVQAIPSSDQWPEFQLPKIRPPPMKRSIGRPVRNRRRQEGEQRKGKRHVSHQCKKCFKWGHNSRTCQGGITASEARQLEGATSKAVERNPRVRPSKRKGSQSSGQGTSKAPAAGTTTRGNGNKRPKHA